mmetsp:Transcript_24662/g.37760  ORF Transcript_24662/g.37760 Transcript_24662/m.37760 type:complete len:530 (-) Transcript_24662:88-1677(-)
MIQRPRNTKCVVAITQKKYLHVGDDYKAIISNMPNVNSLRSRRSSRFRPSLHNVVSSVSSILSPKAGAHQSSDSGWTREIVVAFSGFDPSEQVKKFILQHGGELIIGSDGIRKLHKITHLVVGRDGLKPRRIKFLAALCVCPANIVVCEWIEESFRSKTFIPPDRFHISRYSDVIEQTEMEHTFSMNSTFNNAFAALEDGGILAGMSVYVSPGVIGWHGPSKDEVSALLNASGAVYIDRSSGVKKMMSNQGDVSKLIIITSDKAVPAVVVDALGKGASEMNWTRFVSAMLKQEFGFVDASSQLSLIDNGHIIDITQQARIQQVVSCTDTDFIKVLRIQLDVSPTRSLSNEIIGDPERASLGSNGIFEVYRSATLRTVARYVDSEGIVKFESLVPSPENCHKAIQGNAGRDVCIMWDTCNNAFSSGGTTIRGALKPSNAVAHRRFFFWFNCGDDLKLVLYHLLGNDRGLVNEFFTENSKFFASEITLPDHTTVKPGDAMEEDGQIPVRAGFFGDTAATYTYDPRGESQAF